MLRERNTPLAVQHKSPCFGCLCSRREKIRPASVVSGWSVTIFALHAENGPKWAIFAVHGEFCTASGMPGCVLGEFCPGSGMPACVHGEFCTASGMPACVHGEFCTALGMPACVHGEFCTEGHPSACVQGEFCPGLRPKRGPPGKCCEVEVAGLIAARRCHIWPGGGPAIPAPVPASCRRGQPWPVSVRYTRNRLRATMTAAMRKPVTRRGRLFA